MENTRGNKQQTPSNPDNWLYKDMNEKERWFSKLLFLPDDVPFWDECTNDEKMAWEEAHKPIIPQEATILEEEILAAESK